MHRLARFDFRVLLLHIYGVFLYIEWVVLGVVGQVERIIAVYLVLHGLLKGGGIILSFIAFSYLVFLVNGGRSCFHLVSCEYSVKLLLCRFNARIELSTEHLMLTRVNRCLKLIIAGQKSFLRLRILT